jgi:hypothetical protein
MFELYSNMNQMTAATTNRIAVGMKIDAFATASYLTLDASTARLNPTRQSRR